MIAQSAFLCSLFDTVCSASSGSFFGAGLDVCPVFTTPCGPSSSSDGFLVCPSVSFCTVLARASSLRCRGVVAKIRFACHEAWIWTAMGDGRCRSAGAARWHILLASILPLDSFNYSRSMPAIMVLPHTMKLYLMRVAIQKPKLQ